MNAIFAGRSRIVEIFYMVFFFTKEVWRYIHLNL